MEKSFHHLTLLCFIAITFAPPQYYFSKGEFCAGNTNTTHQAIQFHCVRETTLSNTSDYTEKEYNKQTSILQRRLRKMENFILHMFKSKRRTRNWEYRLAWIYSRNQLHLFENKAPTPFTSSPSQLPLNTFLNSLAENAYISYFMLLW